MALARLIFITGKGGTGKSTIAAALALALSRRNRVILADLDQRLSAARMLDANFNGYPSAKVGENLRLLALSPRSELESFIETIVPLRAISRRMLNSRTFGYVTSALPGLEAFLVLERLRVLAGDAARDDGYLVIDGPATGTALELFSVAAGVEKLAPSGRLNRMALEQRRFLTDHNRFGVLITLRPEELALREALEAASTLKHGISAHLVGAALNGTTRPLFTRAEAETAAGLDNDHGRLAVRRMQLAAAAIRARKRLAEAGLATVELPMLFTGAIGRAQIGQLSHALEALVAR